MASLIKGYPVICVYYWQVFPYISDYIIDLVNINDLLLMNFYYKMIYNIIFEYKLLNKALNC